MMDDTYFAVVAALAMISVHLLYAAGNRKLAEMRQRHKKDLSRVHEQLQAIAVGQASVAERFDRLEARMQRLGHKVAVLTSSCDNEAGATASSRTPPTASSPTSPATKLVAKLNKQPDKLETLVYQRISVWRQCHDVYLTYIVSEREVPLRNA